MSVITTTPHPPASYVAHRSRSVLWGLPAGLAAGAALGVVARVWMRLIAERPEFTWTGTLFIVGAFALFGLAQGAVWAARARRWRRGPLTALRVLAVVASLPIFSAAGAVMFPVVLLASLAVWRTGWPRAVRIGLGVLSGPIVVYVAAFLVREFGFAPATAVRIGLFLAIYAVVIAAVRPVVSAHA